MECVFCGTLVERGVTCLVCESCLSRNVLNATNVIREKKNAPSTFSHAISSAPAQNTLRLDILAADCLVRNTLTNLYLSNGVDLSPTQRGDQEPTTLGRVPSSSQQGSNRSLASVSPPTVASVGGRTNSTASSSSLSGRSNSGESNSETWRANRKGIRSLNPNEIKKLTMERKFGVAWADSNECGVCLTNLKRKHHCRKCGLTTCDKCSEWKKLDERRERVCAFCKYPRFYTFAKGVTSCSSFFDRMNSFLKQRNPKTAKAIACQVTNLSSKLSTVAAETPGRRGSVLRHHNNSEKVVAPFRARSNSSTSRVAARLKARKIARQKSAALGSNTKNGSEKALFSQPQSRHDDMLTSTSNKQDSQETLHHKDYQANFDQQKLHVDLFDLFPEDTSVSR